MSPDLISGSPGRDALAPQSLRLMTATCPVGHGLRSLMAEASDKGAWIRLRYEPRIRKKKRTTRGPWAWSVISVFGAWQLNRDFKGKPTSKTEHAFGLWPGVVLKGNQEGGQPFQITCSSLRRPSETIQA